MAKTDNHTTSEEREYFEQFLFEMDDVLERFLDEAKSAGFELDYSLDSLAKLEEFWLASGETQSDGTIGNRVARYLGEVFRREFGGKWVLCEKGEDYLYNKHPVISGYAKVDIEFCPMEIFANFVYGQKRGILLSAAESHRDFLV